MVKSSQEGIRVWRQIYTSCSWLQLQYRANERRILVGEAIMFLACPGACLDIVDTADPRVPFRF